MNIWLKNLWSHLVPATKSDHNKIVTLLKEINMKLQEALDALDALATKAEGLSAQLTKAQGEITAEIANLQNLDLPPAADAIITRLQTAVGTIGTVTQGLDDLNPDAPATPPTT